MPTTGNQKPTDWKKQSLAARKRAAWKFCAMLASDDALRARCTKRTPAASALAHAKLKQAGQYTNMPSADKLKVVVFEAEELEKDQDTMVLLMLPKKGSLGNLGQFDLDRTWVGTWNHWKN
jgi:hypothetical protein